MIRYYNEGLWQDARHTTVQLPLAVVIIPCCVYLYISIQHNSCLGNSGSPYLRRISSALFFLSARLWQACTVMWFHVLCMHCSPLSRSFSESPHFTSIHLLMLPPFPIVKYDHHLYQNYIINQLWQESWNNKISDLVGYYVYNN